MVDEEKNDDKWRLLITKTDSYIEQMAIDEANMNSLLRGETKPTLRICYFKKPSVSIGFFQSVEKEVNVELCNKLGIEIFRRMTGGGAVYKDPSGELNYSIIIEEDNFKIPFDIIGSYEKICKAVISGLRELGLKAEFRPINDIIVNGRKISGNAQTRKNGILSQHGTILLNVDVDKMFSVLKVSDEKMRDKIIKDVKKRVTSINDELRKVGKKVGFSEVEKAIVNGFERVFSVELEKGELTAREKEEAERLFREKYSTREWNFWR